MSTSTLLASSEHKFAVARANFTKLREEVLNTNIKLIELATKSLVKHLPEEVPSSYYRELLAQGFDLTFIAGINYNKGRRKKRIKRQL